VGRSAIGGDREAVPAVIRAVALVLILATAHPALADGDAAKGAVVFKKCMPCHRVGPGAKTLVGPELNGVVGRKAASIEGYGYSKAMRNSGLTFDEATLTQYLKAPRGLVPGINMTFPGIRKDEDIANLIAYLKTYKADGSPAGP
jgi:cytochrome c